MREMYQACDKFLPFSSSNIVVTYSNSIKEVVKSNSISRFLGGGWRGMKWKRGSWSDPNFRRSLAQCIKRQTRRRSFVLVVCIDAQTQPRKDCPRMKMSENQFSSGTKSEPIFVILSNPLGRGKKGLGRMRSSLHPQLSSCHALTSKDINCLCRKSKSKFCYDHAVIRIALCYVWGFFLMKSQKGSEFCLCFLS